MMRQLRKTSIVFFKLGMCSKLVYISMPPKISYVTLHDRDRKGSSDNGLLKANSLLNVDRGSILK